MACPICADDSNENYHPFCCKRCADLDLGRWMTGHYAIPSENPDDIEELEQALEGAKSNTRNRLN
ncbi:MAG: DNA gyrase inhibitor YacG [Pseudomonadota bacterium]